MSANRDLGGCTVRKILFTLCILLLVPTMATASTDMVSISELRQQVETMGRWTQIYEAYGRTIEVDIPIIVPEVDAVPIVQVSGYYAVDQEGCLTRDGTKLNKIGYDGFDIYEEDGLMKYLGTTDTSGKINVSPFDKDKGVILLAYYNSPSNLRTHKVEYDSKVYYPYEVDADEIYAEDNPQSAAAAKAYLERVLGYFYPESDNSIALRYLEMRSRGHKVKGLDDYNLGEYAKDYPMGTYALSFCQTIHGIPVYHDVGDRLDLTGSAPHELINDAWKKTEPIMGISDNRFEFMGDDSFEMLVRWVKEAGIIKEDVPLAPLSSIISSIEDEIQKGHIRNVYALRLGYGCYITNESPETYVLYPTWICECDYMDDPKWEIDEWAYNLEKGFNKKYTFKTFVINAQTGEMDDPYLSKKEQIFCPTIITWEDAQ